jgi:hypothetical protein
MPDASPAKWHMAHTNWFFEAFVLANVPGYRIFDQRYAFLFNSYYEAVGPRHSRDRRGMLTRPTLADVLAWRGHVDDALTAALPRLDPAALTLVELGINHEQQHQELLLTDILDLFAANQVDLPLPGFGARVPLVGKGNQLVCNAPQALQLGVLGRRQCVFAGGFG